MSDKIKKLKYAMAHGGPENSTNCFIVESEFKQYNRFKLFIIFMLLAFGALFTPARVNRVLNADTMLSNIDHAVSIKTHLFEYCQHEEQT